MNAHNTSSLVQDSDGCMPCMDIHRGACACQPVCAASPRAKLLHPRALEPGLHADTLARTLAAAAPVGCTRSSHPAQAQHTHIHTPPCTGSAHRHTPLTLNRLSHEQWAPHGIRQHMHTHRPSALCRQIATAVQRACPRPSLSTRRNQEALACGFFCFFWAAPFSLSRAHLQVQRALLLRHAARQEVDAGNSRRDGAPHRAHGVLGHLCGGAAGQQRQRYIVACVMSRAGHGAGGQSTAEDLLGLYAFC